MPRISRSTAASDLPSTSSYAHLTDAERAIHHARPIVINGDPKEIATLRPSIPVIEQRPLFLTLPPRDQFIERPIPKKKSRPAPATRPVSAPSPILATRPISAPTLPISKTTTSPDLLPGTCYRLRYIVDCTFPVRTRFPCRGFFHHQSAQ